MWKRDENGSRVLDSTLSAPVLIVSHLTRHDCVTLKFARKIIYNATNISRDVYFCEDVYDVD